METNSPAHSRSRQSVAKDRGFALVLVLAFVALLVGIALAFLSNALLQRQVSNSSANIAKADILAQGAMDTTIGDLKAEIVAGSTPVPITPTPLTGSTNIYQPKPVGTTNPTYPTMVPSLQGVTHGTPTAPNGLENLIKVSASGKAFYSGTGFAGNGPARASTVDTATPSQNGRYIDAKRWNSPLFLQATSATDFTPTAKLPTINWIYVANDGTNPTGMTNPQNITGRYAYAIYDEGGLLDVNVAGYPDALKSNNMSNGAIYRKIGMSYVNLEDLKDPSAPATSLFTQAEAKSLTDWRDYATGQALNSSTVSTKEGAYATAIFSNKTGFLQPSNQTTLQNGQTDQKFVGRQQLIDFVINKLHSTGTRNALQYLTTFSRDLNQPSYIPAIQSDPNNAPKVLQASSGGNSSTYKSDQLINPNFLTTRVQRTFDRNDGTKAHPGDPLVSKRFPLVRLAWVTYLGPSADRNQTDPDIQALINDGIPWSYLQQGTEQNIESYFGLKWDKATNRWLYNIHNGGGTGSGPIMKVGRPSGTGVDPSTYVEDVNRDPDFFELLKAGITVGSLGKTAWTPTAATLNSPSPEVIDTTKTDGSYPAIPSAYSPVEVPANFRYKIDSSIDYQIIQIGANIINEASPASYPIRIGFNDNSGRGIWEIQGVTDIPYLEYIFNGVLPTTANPGNYSWVDNSPGQYQRPGANMTSAGNAYVVQVPGVWNPYDPNGVKGAVRPTQFRIVIDSNDPLHVSNPATNHPIYCAGVATANLGSNGDNSGLQPNTLDVRSYQATSNPTSTTGLSIHDAVDFQDQNGLLYRDPTVIFKVDSFGKAIRENNSATSPVKVGNFSSVNSSVLPAGSSATGTGPWAPLILGQFPLAFTFNTKNYFGTDTSKNPAMYSGPAVIGPGFPNTQADMLSIKDTRVYFTYRLQYQDSTGGWVTYDTKYGRATNGWFSYINKGGMSPSVIEGPNRFNPFSWAAAIDPRTARYGLFMETVNYGRPPDWTLKTPPGVFGWVSDPYGALATLSTRPDNVSSGIAMGDHDSKDQINVWPVNNNGVPGGAGASWLNASIAMEDVPFPQFSAGWPRAIDQINNHGTSYMPLFGPGMYVQNNPKAAFFYASTASPAYYADADGVVRRAAGAYVPGGSNVSASSPVGLPSASVEGGYPNQPQAVITPARVIPFSQAQSRPLLLHRPFRSVAELGYVFRDDPWKNLNFFTPESGDAGLLDLFCINEVNNSDALVAGKVNLNTHQAPVLAAVIGGTYIDETRVTDPTNTVNSVSPALASTIATALEARTSDTTTYGPLLNISELIGKWKAATAITPLSGVNYTYPNSGAGVDIDLPSSGSNRYQDGQSSYMGFSGGATNALASNPPKNLSDALTSAPVSASLRTSLSQIQRFREAPIRALAGAGQTRVWNLMIDVVAQAGRIPTAASGLDKFVVEGERRYWVHIAIDRLTGAVLDQEVEIVKE